MIKYKLICKNCEDYFDSWFSSSKEYEKLKKQNFLNCPICNSFNIEKTLMSPNVLRSKINIKDKNNKYKKIEEKYQKFIKQNFNYVGENFAYEARSIHYKDKKTSKGIYGYTTKEELQELREEGVEVKEVPWKKDAIN
tara:strand:- start:484 stop:897 length:414 start_codon:yes stop_codon:yes gene_type:complete